MRDNDNDGILNTKDNCLEIKNPDQLDSDNDGFGNVCDADYDNNNIVDKLDFNLFKIKFQNQDVAADLDGNGIVNLDDFTAFAALRGKPPGPGAEEPVDESTVMGRVIDTAGIIISDSTVTVYQEGKIIAEPIAVNNKGEFSLKLPASKSFSLLVSAPNFANQIVPVSSPSVEGQISISTTLIRRGQVITINNTGVNTQTDNVGASVTFDKANFVDANGQPVAGDLQLTITPVDVSKPAYVAAFPGSFSGIAEGDIEPSEIISLGTVEYHFTQNGIPVNLAENKTAEILIPIYVKTYQNGTAVALGDVIPLWSLEESTGVWVQEGTGEVVASENSITGMALRASVSHFSWWNADFIAAIATVKITVLGELAGDATILATASDLINWRNAFTTIGVGNTTDPLRIPAGIEVCMAASIDYDNGAFAITERVCVTANVGEMLAVTLSPPPGDGLNVITNPLATADDALNIHTVTNQPIPVVISPITAETAVTYSITDGQLPAGLSLNTFGTQASIVGSPTTEGTFSFAITATDSDGFSDVVTFQYFVENSSNAISLSFVGTNKLNLLVGASSGTASINWNDGSPIDIISSNNPDVNNSVTGLSYSRVFHEYASTHSGSITISFSAGIEAATVLGATRYNGAKNTFDFDVATLLKANNLKQIVFDRNGLLKGEISSISSSLEHISINGNNSSVTGAVKDLPPGLISLSFRGKSGVSGNIQELPRTLTRLHLTGKGLGESGLLGNIANLPEFLKTIFLQDNGFIEGDISLLPETLTVVGLFGENTITGNLSTLHRGVTGFFVRGKNTVTGDIATMPETMTQFQLMGNNTVTGDISTLPTTLFQFEIFGQNTVKGDISTLLDSVTLFTVQGNNTITGDISTLSGNMRTFNVLGQNTVYGDLGLITANKITVLNLGGNNTVDQFSASPIWAPNNLRTLFLLDGGSTAFDSSEVDSLLNYLNTLAFSTKRGVIIIQRKNDAPPTSASATSILELKGKGFTVGTN